MERDQLPNVEVVPLPLSCVNCKTDGSPDLWTPVAVGNWKTDNETGVRHADDVIDRMQQQDHPFLLGHTVKAMIEKGVYGGVEVGFFNHLALRLITMKTAYVTFKLAQYQDCGLLA